MTLNILSYILCFLFGVLITLGLQHFFAEEQEPCYDDELVDLPEKPLVYLAVPYSAEDPWVKRERFLAATRKAAEMMSAGLSVYSPITHSHLIAIYGRLPTSWDFWAPYDRAMLSICYELCVLRLDGWETSKGVQAEIAIAEELGLKITYLDP